MKKIKKNIASLRHSLIFFILASSFLISFSMKYQQVSRRTDLLSLDPWYFATATNTYLATGITTKAGVNYLLQDQGYPKGIVISTALLQRLTNQPVNEIYRWLGPIITSLFAIFFFLATKSTFGVLPALIGGWLFEFSSYTLNRGIVTVPENLALVMFFIILYGLLKKNWLCVGFGFLAMAAFHNSFLYFLPTLLLLPLLVNWPVRKKLIVLISLFGAGGLLALFFKSRFEIGTTLAKQFLQSDIYFVWPKIDFLTSLLHPVLILFGIVGLAITLIAYLRKPHYILAIILSLGIPFSAIILFFQGQSKIDFGPILPERFFLYFGLILALATSWLLQHLFKRYHKTHLEPVIFLAIFAIMSYFQPTKIAPWFWVFSPKEVEASNWMRDNTPPNSKIISQPLLGWLLRAETKRPTVDAQLDVPLEHLLAISSGVNKSYIFISRTKVLTEYYTYFSDGTTGLVGYTRDYLPPVKESLYLDLPKVFDNKEVVVYQLK